MVGGDGGRGAAVGSRAMRSAGARLMTQLADRSIAAELAIRRDRFVEIGGAFQGRAAKAGGFGGSGYREHMRKLCAAELHERAELLGDAVREAHEGISGTSSDAMLRAAKGWIAERIAQEAKTFGAFLWKPNESFGEKGDPDNLNDEVRRERDAAFAVLDLHWEQLRQNRIERVIRLAARVWGRLRSLVHS